jgi:mRNA-degrading endonuclease toxin of MazEF toxin-antitoxin module
MNRMIRSKVVKIGNSRGIGIPRTVLEQAGLTDRVNCQFEGTSGHIVLDQIRTVDKSRLVKKLGKIPDDTQCEVLAVLSEMFSE